MKNINNYFNAASDKYYDAKYIINVLEDILEMPILSIKEHVKSSNVTATEDEIKKFLNDTLAKENPTLKERMEKPKPNSKISLGKHSVKDILESTQDFMDKLEYERYEYEPYALKYYKKYTNILKSKINRLLYIIENIGIKKYNAIQNELLDLDIVLDNNGNILKSDIIRLITPTVYNIEKLEEKINEANNLSTYLTNKISLHKLYKEGCSEEEIYPTKSLQTKNLYNGNLPGEVKLSDNQKQELREKQSKSIKIMAKVLVDDLFS